MELTIYHKNIKKFSQNISQAEDLLPAIDNFMKASKISISNLNIVLSCKESSDSLSCRAALLTLEIFKLAKGFIKK